MSECVNASKNREVFFFAEILCAAGLECVNASKNREVFFSLKLRASKFLLKKKRKKKRYYSWHRIRFARNSDDVLFR